MTNNDDKTVQTPDDSPEETAPERAVLLTGEHLTELLQEGETEAEVFEPDGEEDLKREDVTVASLSGPHPLFTTSQTSHADDDARSRWIPEKVDYAVLAFGLLAVGGIHRYFPRTTLQINGEATTFPPEGIGVWLVLIGLLFVSWYATVLLSPNQRRHRGWSA